MIALQQELLENEITAGNLCDSAKIVSLGRQEAADAFVEGARLLHVAHMTGARKNVELGPRDGSPELLGNGQWASAIFISPKKKRRCLDCGEQRRRVGFGK